MIKALIMSVLLFSGSAFASSQIEVGKPAPDFSVKDAYGKVHTLEQYKGKTVVLEWYNKDCPYVRKHYDTQNMQNQQKRVTDDGAIWLSVVSSAPGKQGHQAPAEAAANQKSEGSHATAVLIDESGEMGKAYGAKTTPHMFVIDAAGKVQYHGAIDSDDSFKQSAVAGATQYAEIAYKTLKKGEAVAEPFYKPYGCGVKY